MWTKDRVANVTRALGVYSVRCVDNVNTWLYSYRMYTERRS